MRSLTIAKCLPYVSGPSVFALEEARMLSRLGHQVEFLTYSDYPLGILGKEAGNISSGKGINFHRVPVPKTGKTVAPMIETALLSKAIEIAEKERVDFINAHYSIPHGSVAVTLAHFLGVPAVVTLHGSDVDVLANGRDFRAASRMIFSQADILVTVSESLKKGVQHLMGDDPPKVTVLPTAVDTEKFTEGERRQKENSSVLYVGRLAEGKGLGTLLKAFASLTKRLPQVTLRIVGVGPTLPQLKMEIRRLDLQKVVEITEGALEELPRIYQEADILALCSRREGMPNVICEALASGLPIVTTPVGDIPRFLEEGVHCLYTKVGDTHELANKIKSLVANSLLGEEMGRANRTLALTQFDLRTRCEALIRLVEGRKEEFHESEDCPKRDSARTFSPRSAIPAVQKRG
jgi:glycosyltransferase involved in cell wall biosynthesis